MADADLTVTILRELREEMRSRFDSLGTRIDSVEANLGARIDAIETGLGGVGDRLDTVDATLRELAGQQLILTRYVKNSFERHGERIDDLDYRVAELEAKPTRP